MGKSLWVGTAADFKYRIPLSFYPFLGLCALGLLLHVPLDIEPSHAAAIVGIFATGLVLRVWGSSLLTSAIVVDAKAHATKLIDQGPFALMRNPLYTGAGFMLAAIVFFLPPAVLVPFAVYSGVIGLRLALYEERLMHESFGAAYDAYVARTGRYLPHPLKWHRIVWHDALHAGHLKNAVLSEFIFVLYFACLVAALMAHDSRILYGGVIASSLIGGSIVKKSAKQAKI
jgi:protein-S-isoprenylcysteine O-methyltransferase Ste14